MSLLFRLRHNTLAQISLFVAARAQEDGRSLWKMLGLPSYVVFELPKFRLTEVASAV